MEDEITSLTQAFEAVETEQAEAAKETPTEETPAQEPAPEAAPTEAAAQEDKAPEGEPLAEDNPFKAEYDERIKGYQRAYTKKVQNTQSESDKKFEALREEYDQKLQTALAKISNPAASQKESESAEDNSIDTLFEGYDPKSIETFKTAVNKMSEKAIQAAIAPLIKENEQLKGYVTQQVSNSESQTKINAALEAIPALKDPTIQHELTTWAEANPNEVRGLSIPQMYKMFSYDRQKELGKLEAKKEFERKEKEQPESGGVSNTVEDGEYEDVEAAFNAAVSESKLKGN